MIDEHAVLAILRGALAAIEQLAAAHPNGGPMKPATSVVNGLRIDDRDLDGPYGNPVIKAADPRDWIGPSMKGKTLSECSPEYLFLLASRHDYFAAKAEEEGAVTSSGKPKAPYERREAARCRGWAQRKLNGWRPPAPEPSALDADRMPTHDEIFGSVFGTREPGEDDVF
jgi:hypothetical protein